MKNIARKYYVLFISIFYLSFSAQAQEVPFDGHKWEAPYYFPLPEKWTFERFLIPIGFASSIPYKGVEDIRFAPGWGKKDSEQYWSYAFLWWLENGPRLNAEILSSRLKAYYTGLMRVNIDTAKHLLSAKDLIATTSFQKLPTAKGDRETYSGTIQMLDYMQLKTIKLNCMVHVRPCASEKRYTVFFELSPQPFTHAIWNDFKTLREGFRCKK